MWKNMLARRTEEGLRECLRVLDKLKQDGPPPSRKGDTAYAPFEWYNMLLTARLMTKAALRRKESRGSHYREDYSERSSDYGTPFIMGMDEDGDG
jgi:succinate dehydrogenase/fumarate reductase flavoprotein subunit